MKTNKLNITSRGLFKTGLSVALAASVGLATQANAAGTPSGTTILNTVTLDYSVNNINQDDVTADVDFLVGNKVDLTVTANDAAAVSVTPGATTTALAFEIQNDGNTLQDFVLSAANTAGGPVSVGSTSYTDNADMGTTFTYYLDDGDDIFDANSDTLITYVDELAPDASVTVFLVVDAPSTLSDDQYAGIQLNVTTHDGGAASSQGAETTASTGAFDRTVVQTVLADAGTDGVESTTSVYHVVSANIFIAKDVTVKSDPINGTTNPKAIPGAIVTYTIIVENRGTVDATDITISDNINAITGIKDDTVANLTVNYTGAGTVDSSATDAGLVNVTITTIASTDGTDGSGNDYLTITFDAEIE